MTQSSGDWHIGCKSFLADGLQTVLLKKVVGMIDMMMNGKIIGPTAASPFRPIKYANV